MTKAIEHINEITIVLTVSVVFILVFHAFNNEENSSSHKVKSIALWLLTALLFILAGYADFHLDRVYIKIVAAVWIYCFDSLVCEDVFKLKSTIEVWLYKVLFFGGIVAAYLNFHELAKYINGSFSKDSEVMMAIFLCISVFIIIWLLICLYKYISYKNKIAQKNKNT